MTLVAVPEVDPSVVSQTVSASLRGKRRVRFWMVPTPHREEALEASGIPAFGAALPGPDSGFVAVDHEAGPHPNRAGWTLVRVNAYTPELAIRLDDTIAGEAGPAPYHELSTAVGTVQTAEAYNELTREVEPIAGGQTLPEEVVRAEIVAHVFVDPGSYLTLFSHWKTIQGRHNENAVQFPPARFQTVPGPVAASGELLARPIASRAIREGLIEVIMTFAIAPVDSWRSVVTLYDGEGIGTSYPYRAQGPPVAYNLSSVLTPPAGDGGGG